ncbi:putative late embryogenesis abundant protein, LEA-14 [Tanacetum coccineum]
MMHEKSEIDDSSLGDSISPSSSSPKHGYYVQSPSRDSHDDKSSTNSRHSTPIESPSHSSHSRTSSSSRVSGPYRFSLVGKHHPSFLRKKKGWPPLFSVIDEEDEDYDDDDLIPDKQFMRQFRFLMLLIGFVMVFTIVCLIIWGASRPYKFQVHMKSWKVNNFYYGEGSDNTGVSTKLLTINCTVKMNIHNPATFFGIHVSSTSLDLLYLQIVVGRGQFLNYYQPKKSQRTMSVNVEGRQVPLYGAGWGLVMSNSNGRVPVKLKFEIHSQANLVGRLVKTKHRRQVFCIMEMESQNNKFVNFKENSCSYS